MEENITKENMTSSIENIPAIADEIEDRKKKLLELLKKKGQWIYYVILSIIVFIGTYVRTRNIPKLKDITTGTWTLGPDLDPFLFLRWAKYIAENGKLFLLDKMRSVPLAEICSGKACNPINTAGEMKLLSYMIVGLYRFLSIFKETTVTYAAIIFPALIFALTIIAFFLFARKVFYKKDEKTRNIIALISTAFFSLIPPLLPRTIAGIPEKESAAFLFIFLSFYFFLEAFTSEKLKRGLLFGGLAGISTGLLALIWGGFGFVFMTIPMAVFFAFLLDKIDYKKFLVYGIWILMFMFIALPFSTRYTLSNVLESTSTGIAYMVLFVIGVDLLIFKKRIFKLDEKIKAKIKFPEKIISLIISGLILIFIGSIFFGISFIPHMVTDIFNEAVHPLAQSRFSVTVAENKQPYFIGDWQGEFGPMYFDIPLFFWLFFIGSILLFANLIKPLGKKEKITLIASYSAFLFGLIFSKYSSSSKLDGNSTLSLLVYFGGILFFLGSFGYFYFKRYKENKLSIFSEFEFPYILYFMILTMTIIAARGAIRLIMVLAAVSPLAVGFFVFKIPSDYFTQKDNTKKFFLAVISIVIIIVAVFTLWTYYQNDKAIGASYAPGSYQWQWQKAMAWIRENTSENAVFAHWWDYGYWLQSIGERATIVDGGNAVGYWNHFMGRYVLTGDNEKQALEFLYAHNATHLLIDSTDIGKYAAFSSIGSDGNYDRYSWIPTLLMDERQTQETNNLTAYIYPGGTAIDEDIVWNVSGKEILLPRKIAGLAGIIMKETNNKTQILQPEGIFVYNGVQYNIPLRYAHVNDKLYDFESGLDAGVFVFPRLDYSSSGMTSNTRGAMFYLSPRVINSRVARLYLFGQDSDYIKTAHIESSVFVNDLRSQGFYMGEFVYYQGFQGPIKIWEIDYPSDIKLNKDFLETLQPSELTTVITSEYG